MLYLELILLGISLSMDAFSLAISLSLIDLSKNKSFNYSIVVGIFHFIMPVLGNVLKRLINNFYLINTDKLFIAVIIFIIIGIVFDNNKTSKKTLNPFVFAFMVSIDSFSLGLSLESKVLLKAIIIFSLTSFIFTYTGFSIGKYINNNFEKYSKIISVSILLIVLIFKLL